MQVERYPFIKHPKRYFYEFESAGPNGLITKVVEFSRLQWQENEVYNLAFGDWNENAHFINDLVISNNADKDKVLATVAATVIEFMQEHPSAIIFAVGSTASRTRLYQMGIAKILNEINQFYEIQGYINDLWEPFQRGVNYNAFLFKTR